MALGKRSVDVERCITVHNLRARYDIDIELRAGLVVGENVGRHGDSSVRMLGTRTRMAMEMIVLMEWRIH